MSTKPRILAIGDVHGCLTALDALLELVAPRDEDTLIFLGDYIDRGPDSPGVIERLIGLSKRDGFVALRGNHDWWMWRARQVHLEFFYWLAAGGAATLKSYGAQNLDDVGDKSGHELEAFIEASFEGVPTSHWNFLETLRDFYETAEFIFTHASIEADLPLEEMSDDALLWQRVTDAGSHFSGETLICGHSSQKNGVPLDLGHAICIDTCAYGGRWLSCLDVRNRYLWQANQKGETRQGWLDDFTS